jgi:hypothetical protein
MPTNKKLVGIMLDHTTDPEEAAYLAYLLGNEVVTHSTQAFLPPAWVLAKQQDCAKVAVWAIEHCNNHDTLLAIAKTPAFIKRASVKRALGCSKYLSQAEFIAATTPKAKPIVVRTAQEIVDAQIVKLSSLHKNRQQPILKELEFLNDPAVLPATIDKAFMALCSAMDGSWAQKSYVLTKCGIQDRQFYFPAWEKGSLSVVDVFTGLDATQRENMSSVICTVMLWSITRDEYIKTTPALIEADVVELLMKIDPKRLVSVRNYNSALERVRPTFTDAALDLLMRRPKWRWLATYHSLNADQLASLVKLTPVVDRYQLLCLIQGKRTLAEVILNARISDKIDDSYYFIEVARALNGPGDPLWEKVLKYFSPEVVILYMLGRSTSNHKAIGLSVCELPNVDMIPTLLRVIDKVPSVVVADYVNDGFFRTDLSENTDYYCALIDQVPHALRCGIEVSDTYPKLAEHILRRLNSTGATPEMILEQVWINPDKTLNQLCAVLGAFTRSTAK